MRDKTGPSRLLDMVEGRSKQAFKTWLAARPKTWRDGIEVVVMDGFTGFKTATSEELPDAVAVLDPFHVVKLAGEALDKCRRRIQQRIHEHRGRKVDPADAGQYASVVATGRSDYPNQINNVLVFPGLFKGMLKANASRIDDEMLRAAAIAVADVVTDDQRNSNYIIPGVFDPRVAEAVSRAVVRYIKDNPVTD